MSFSWFDPPSAGKPDYSEEETLVIDAFDDNDNPVQVPVTFTVDCYKSNSRSIGSADRHTIYENQVNFKIPDGVWLDKSDVMDEIKKLYPNADYL